MFDPKNMQVPCVGVSIGAELIFAVLEAKNTAGKIKVHTNDFEVFVAFAHKGLHSKRLAILTKLWQCQS
jgi:histidyl-tRNA synthetase